MGARHAFVPGRVWSGRLAYASVGPNEASAQYLVASETARFWDGSPPHLFARTGQASANPLPSLVHESCYMEFHDSGTGRTAATRTPFGPVSISCAKVSRPCSAPAPVAALRRAPSAETDSS